VADTVLYVWKHCSIHSLDLPTLCFNSRVTVTKYSSPITHKKQTRWRLILSSCFLQSKFMPDIEQVTVFCHCIWVFANLGQRYAACAAKNLAECAREVRRWQVNLNWQIQGSTVFASHLDTLHATVGRYLHLDKAKWNVYTFRSQSVSSLMAELPSCAALPASLNMYGM